MWRGVELDPLYVDVIIRRYEEATGNPAVLVETGETFELLALRRASEAVKQRRSTVRTDPKLVSVHKCMFSWQNSR